MIRVGLTGGYATGKSFVACEFQRLGCVVISADRIGHEVLRRGGEAFEPVVEAFGIEILDANREIDRKRLGNLVFAHPDLLARLTAIVHPAVYAREDHLLREAADRQPDAIAVVEAAILIETGRYRAFDKLILTICQPETQIARAMTRDGLTREQVLMRLNRQLPVEDKKALAHYLIDTDGNEAGTLQQVKEIYAALQEIAYRPPENR